MWNDLGVARDFWPLSSLTLTAVRFRREAEFTSIKDTEDTGSNATGTEGKSGACQIPTAFESL